MKPSSKGEPSNKALAVDECSWPQAYEAPMLTSLGQIVVATCGAKGPLIDGGFATPSPA